ncbi:MAG: HEAT repeat domain-containing protein [Planctomycetota bacterium]
MSSPSLAARVLLISLPSVFGCASASNGPAGQDPAAGPDGAAEGIPVALDERSLVWNPDQNQDHRKLGVVLADLDGKLRTWQRAVLGGGGAGLDANQVKDIEIHIAHDAQKYMDQLMDQLVAGPQNNRRVSAAALGFTRSERALPPLLSALVDPDPEVISNALLSLGTLGVKDTPLSSIAALMNEHDRPSVRTNAGRALRALLPLTSDTGDREEVRAAARRGLGDEEAGVRMYSLLLLAELIDFESLDRMAFALDDKTPLVAKAASRGIAYIGSERQESFGQAARALVAGLGRVDRDAVRPTVERDLQALGQRNYKDMDDWLEWANRLP